MKLWEVIEIRDAMISLFFSLLAGLITGLIIGAIIGQLIANNLYGGAIIGAIVIGLLGLANGVLDVVETVDKIKRYRRT